jgi:uncharacterized membrane protein YgdD (TMEM256/DUF423 family)
MKTIFLAAGTIGGATGVIIGAFAAHGLRSVLSEENLRIFHTAVEYQFYHSFALIICGIFTEKNKSKYPIAAGYLFLSGIILFSGSLYVLAINSSLGAAGMITPLGGLSFIAGWVLLTVSFFRSGYRSSQQIRNN